jgi:hypothetical protein
MHIGLHVSHTGLGFVFLVKANVLAQNETPVRPGHDRCREGVHMRCEWLQVNMVQAQFKTIRGSQKERTKT